MSPQRVEAGKREWRELLDEQRDAIEKAIDLLASFHTNAKSHLATPVVPTATAWPSTLVPELRKPGPAQLVFFEGGRGFGKTTAALTLLSLLGNRPGTGDPEACRALHTRGNIGPDVLAQMLPVALLDARPLPGHTPPAMWLMQPFIALADEIAKNDVERRSLSEDDSGKDLSTLRRSFVQAVAGGWSGREPPSSGDDVDFAFEVANRERLRASVAPLWRRFIDTLAGRLSALSSDGVSPLMVVLVDDVDLNFQHTAEIFELIRHFAHPCVAYVATGEFEQLREAFQIRLGADMAGPLRDSDWGDEYFDEERSGRVVRLADALLEKLIPPENRASLPELPPDEWRRIVLRPELEGTSAALLVDAIHSFPPALSALEPRSVRATQDLARLLVRLSVEEDTLRRHRAVSEFASSRPNWRLAAAQGSAPGLSFVQERQQLVSRGRAIRGRDRLSAAVPIHVISDQTVMPAASHGNIVAGLLAQWAADFKTPFPLDEPSQLGWAPVWSLMTAESTQDFPFQLEGEVLRPWPRPDASDLRRFVDIWKDWQRTLDRLGARRRDVTAVVDAYLGLHLRALGRSGRKSVRSRRRGNLRAAAERFVLHFVNRSVEDRTEEPLVRAYSVLLSADLGLPAGAVRHLLRTLSAAADSKEVSVSDVLDHHEVGDRHRVVTEWLAEPRGRTDRWQSTLRAVTITFRNSVSYADDVARELGVLDLLGGEERRTEFEIRVAESGRLTDAYVTLLPSLAAPSNGYDARAVLANSPEGPVASVQRSQGPFRRWVSTESSWRPATGTEGFIPVREGSRAIELNCLFALSDFETDGALPQLAAALPVGCDPSRSVQG